MYTEKTLNTPNPGTNQTGLLSSQSMYVGALKRVFQFLPSTNPETTKTVLTAQRFCPRIQIAAHVELINEWGHWKDVLCLFERPSDSVCRGKYEDALVAIFEGVTNKKNLPIQWFLKHGPYPKILERLDPELIVQVFTTNKEINPNEMTHVLEFAFKNGLENIVTAFLAHPKLDPRSNNSCAFRLATQYKKQTLVKTLLQHKIVQMHMNKTEVVCWARLNNLLDVGPKFSPKEMLTPACMLWALFLRFKPKANNIPPHEDVDALEQAFEYKLDNIVRAFLQNPEFHSPLKKQYADKCIQWAVKNNCAEGALNLLKHQSRLSRQEYSRALAFASKEGHVEIVRLLLKGKRANPSASNNYAIRWAAENGHIEVVKLLLNDKRVDPSAGKNNAIRMACRNGHVKAVKLLLADKRVDPSAQNNQAFYRAFQHKHKDVLDCLLSDSRADYTKRLFIAICEQKQSLEAVSLLLGHKKASPVSEWEKIVLHSAKFLAKTEQGFLSKN